VPTSSIRSHPEIKKELRSFLRTDNYTNFLYIGRVYLVLAVAIGGAIAFFEYQQAAGLSPIWNIPVFILCALAVGASQHQLTGAGHEAVHHTLFKNRKLNELAADWLCMYPMFSSAYQFRLYHLAHHQFVNDPEKDPDFSMLKESGHWFNFPVSKMTFMRKILRQLLIIDLIRYIGARIRYNTIGMHEDSPYRGEGSQKLWPARLGLIQFLATIGLLIATQAWGEPWQVFALPVISWMALTVIYVALPDDAFDRAKLRPVIQPRVMFICRTGFVTFLLATLGCVQAATEFMALRYFTLLFYLPSLTVFPFFMILRQVIQHGNGDRGWLTNTRVFHVNPFLRYAVFPFGMDYHLPHHMYATVPHYRLPALHDFLLKFPEYADSCQIVENYVIPNEGPPRNPTVLEVLGPDYAGSSDEIYTDDSVLDDWEVEGKVAHRKTEAEEAPSEPANRPKTSPGHLHLNPREVTQLE